MKMTYTSVARGLAAAAAIASFVACDAKQLDIANPNSATVEGAVADPTSFQLLATGLLVDQRNLRTGMITWGGPVGRESYSFQPTEGRPATHPVIGIIVNGVQKLDPTGFAVAPWAGQYQTLRDVFNFKNTVSASSLVAAQKSAALGFAQTIEAIMLFDIIQTHDTLGAIVEIRENATDLAPFVSRDSTYKYILATLDQSITNLTAGGSAFPFTMHTGYTGFNTPATFAKFTQALKGKVAAHYATSGGPATAWQTSLTALNASFINPAGTSRAGLDAGVYVTFAASPDSPNGLTQATNTNLYAHMSYIADAQLKADGVTKDDRFTSKIRFGLPQREGPQAGGSATTASSTIGFSIWPAISSSIPVIRNEELILLRAEAKLGTGDKAGAIADLNIVRINSGGLPASTLTAGNTNDEILLGILYEKRYSLMMEGNRWVDHRRYGKLALLPLDIASGPNKNFVARVSPIPQAECLVRAKSTGDLLGPGGLNNCAP
ncbi:MAG: RagB/SusD family nutrient uptake outer membrane protein [bacterium]